MDRRRCCRSSVGDDEFVVSGGRSQPMTRASQLIRPDEPFVLRQRRPALADDDAFLRFARGLDGFGVESDGEVVTVMSPGGWASGARNAIITGQLCAWARATRLGRATDSSALYRLSGGGGGGPPPAWVSLPRPARGPAPETAGGVA